MLEHANVGQVQKPLRHRRHAPEASLQPRFRGGPCPSGDRGPEVRGLGGVKGPTPREHVGMKARSDSEKRQRKHQTLVTS